MSKLEKNLITLGILSTLLAVLMYFPFKHDNAIYILIVPFDCIVMGLRWLSLSSVAGNILALGCYLLLSLLPVLYLILKRRKAGLRKADLLLPVISVYLFFMLYEFINPGLMLKRIPELPADNDMLPILKLSFAITFYSFVIGYLILRMLGNLSYKNSLGKLDFLCHQLKRILVIFSVVLTFLLCYSTPIQIFSELKQNSQLINKGIIDTLFIILCALLKVLPAITSIIILIFAIKLLNAIINDHLQEEEILAASRLSFVSKTAVYITVICNIVINTAQFLFSKMLSDTNYNLEFSWFPLVVAFLAMILAGYFKETKEIYDDNEMII